MKINSAICSAIASLLLAANLSAQKKCVLSGEVSGIPDQTMIYLQNAVSNVKIDSAKVIGGKFKLSAVLDGPAMQVLLHTTNFSDYTFFWIDGPRVQFKAEKGAFKKATITGSEAQATSARLADSMTPLDMQRDSLIGLLGEDPASNPRKDEIIKSIQALDTKEKEAYIDFVRRNPGSIVSAQLLSVYASTWGKEMVAPLYAGLTPAMKSSLYGKKAGDYIRLYRNPQVGEQMADIAQPDAGGKTLKLSDFKGKYVLLDFWAAWCGPCRMENPNLVKIYADYKDKGFEILGVSLDKSRQDWLNAIQKDGLKWPNVSDLKGDANEAALTYGVSSIPSNWLIDPNGKVIDKGLRGERLRERLSGLLDTLPGDPEQRLKALGIELPTPTQPVANYVKFVRTGNLIYLAGHGPSRADGSYVTGKLGRDLTVDQGYEAARLTGISLIATLKAATGGDLKKVKRVVKVLGLVNCTDSFTDQPKVINGFSDLMTAVFGEAGKHARSAVGTNALPLGIAVEIEMIVEVEGN